MMSESTHRAVIRAISHGWPTGEPFALSEVMRGASISKTSAVRILNRLVELRLLKKSMRSYKGKKYRVTSQWQGEVPVINAFEFAKAVGI